MDFSPVIEDLKQSGLAARRYEREGHRKFRDCVTVGRNGRLLFQLFSWGEAASLAFEAKGRVAPGGAMVWAAPVGGHMAGETPPARLSEYKDGTLLFDGKPQRWAVAAEHKYWPKGGLGVLGKLFAR
jgi:hypothetical protein